MIPAALVPASGCTGEVQGGPRLSPHRSRGLCQQEKLVRFGGLLTNAFRHHRLYFYVAKWDAGLNRRGTAGQLRTFCRLHRSAVRRRHLERLSIGVSGYGRLHRERRAARCAGWPSNNLRALREGPRRKLESLASDRRAERSPRLARTPGISHRRTAGTSTLSDGSALPSLVHDGALRHRQPTPSGCLHPDRDPLVGAPLSPGGDAMDRAGCARLRARNCCGLSHLEPTHRRGYARGARLLGRHTACRGPTSLAAQTPSIRRRRRGRRNARSDNQRYLGERLPFLRRHRSLPDRTDRRDRGSRALPGRPMRGTSKSAMRGARPDSGHLFSVPLEAGQCLPDPR